MEIELTTKEETTPDLANDLVPGELKDMFFLFSSWISLFVCVLVFLRSVPIWLILLLLLL